VVVDDDIDPTDIHDVIWAMGTRCDPKTMTTLLDRCWSSRLDTMVTDYSRLYNSRMVIDACRPYERIDAFPPSRKARPNWPRPCGEISRPVQVKTMRRSPFLRSLASVAVAAGALPVPAGAQELPTITLATLINDTATSALYASRAGIFRKFGLNVELEVLTSGLRARRRLPRCGAVRALEPLRLYVGTTKACVHARRAGRSLYIDVAYSQFVVKTDSPIKTGRDMNGKTIGAPGLKDWTRSPFRIGSTKTVAIRRRSSSWRCRDRSRLQPSKKDASTAPT